MLPFPNQRALSALLAIVVCLSSEPSAAQSVSVEKRWANPGNAGILEFGAISGMAEARDGSIWISDEMSRAVATVNASGGGLQVVAEQGGGPGELGVPSLVAKLPSGEMGIYDPIRSGIHVFGTDRRFRRQIRLSAAVLNPKGFAAIPTGGFVISGGSPSRAGSLHRFDAVGRLITSWRTERGARDPRARMFIAGGPVSVTADGSLLFSQAAPHGIYVYPKIGTIDRLIASLPSVVPPIGDAFVQVRNGQRTFQWEFRQSAAVFPLPNNEILNVVWDAGGKYSLWEVYRSDGRRVARGQVSPAYRPWGITQNGDVLASYTDPQTDEVFVTRLKVKVQRGRNVSRVAAATQRR